MGKPWGSITHLIHTEGQVVEAHAVQRRPRDERWSREELGNIRATPWQRAPPEGDQLPEIEVIPGKAADEQDRPDDCVEEVRHEPHPMHITRADLEKWG